MDRDTDRPCLVGYGTGYSLTYPPCCIGRELISLLVIELLNCLDKTEVAFLDKIKEQHTPAHISLGDTYYKTEVGFSKTFLGLLTFLTALLHLLGKLNLLFGRQKRNLTYFLKVHPDRVFNTHTVGYGQIDVLHINLILL